MRAVQIILECFQNPELDLRRIYLGGRGGTGKSVVIKAVQYWLFCHNRSSEIICLAMVYSCIHWQIQN